ncbi:MAG: NUDIX domain-containing protein [Actinomycetota bacterium]
MPERPTESIDGGRAVVRTLVEELVPIDELERRHRRDTLAWIDSGAPIHRTAKPATPPEHLVSYCVVVDPDRRALLLVDHRLAQRWLPAGGHVEPAERPEQAARRELWEELGLASDFWPGIGDRPLFLTRTRAAGRSTPHLDVSLWFVFTTSRRAELAVDEREFAGARWWGLDEIGPAVAEGVRFDEHLPRFVAKLARYGLKAS